MQSLFDENKIIIYIWPDIDIYAIKLLWKYAFLYFTCIIRTQLPDVYFAKNCVYCIWIFTVC